MANALTVLIPAHGRTTLLERTLDSLAACRKPTTYRETIVVENGPQEDAEAIVSARAADERVRYLYIERANKSHALNEALETAAPDPIVFFDDDVRLAPSILQAYDDAASGRKRGAFFGGPFSIDYEEDPPDWLLPHLPFSARGVEFDDWPRPDYFLGFSWAAFGDDIRNVGGFGPNHGPGSPTGASGQESSMQRLLRRRDVEQIKVPDARVWHYVPHERCSPEWVVQRPYRSGMSRGTEERREHKRRRTVRAAKSIVKRLPRAAGLLHRRGSREWYDVIIPISWSPGILCGYLFPSARSDRHAPPLATPRPPERCSCLSWLRVRYSVVGWITCRIDCRMTVIIPTHGRSALLRRTLESLAACHRPPAYRETVIVENGPRGSAEAIVSAAAAAHPGLGLRYLHVERANKSAALNEALATVEPGLVVFFDDDVRLSTGVLAAYAEATGGWSGGGAFFGGPFGVDYEEVPPGWLVPHLPWSAQGVEFDEWPRPGHFLGFNWAAFTDDIQSAGGFDPNYGPGSPTGASGQESEMQRRMKKQGIEKICVPEAHVWHHVPRERCSSAWALHRKYRAGLEKGTLLRARSGSRLLTVAEYTARSLLAAARWAKWTALGDRPKQFGEQAALSKHRGVLASITRPSSRKVTS